MLEEIYDLDHGWPNLTRGMTSNTHIFQNNILHSERIIYINRKVENDELTRQD
jgi:hypothetical protein